MGLQTVEIPVSGMTCGNCARAVERKLSTSPGVSSARVDLAGGTATVQFDAARTELTDLLHAIEQLGFTVRQ
jgi:copper chaperone CopZ